MQRQKWLDPLQLIPRNSTKSADATRKNNSMSNDLCVPPWENTFHTIRLHFFFGEANEVRSFFAAVFSASNFAFVHIQLFS